MDIRNLTKPLLCWRCCQQTAEKTVLLLTERAWMFQLWIDKFDLNARDHISPLLRGNVLKARTNALPYRTKTIVQNFGDARSLWEFDIHDDLFRLQEPRCAPEMRGGLCRRGPRAVRLLYHIPSSWLGWLNPKWLGLSYTDILRGSLWKATKGQPEIKIWDFSKLSQG